MPYNLYLSWIGINLDSSSWSMVRGKDYVGNLSEIQDRFIKGKYKGGPGFNNGRLKKFPTLEKYLRILYQLNVCFYLHNT